MTRAELIQIIHPKINVAIKAIEGFSFIVTTKVLRNAETELSNYAAKHITIFMKDIIQQIYNILENQNKNTNDLTVVSGEDTCSIDDGDNQLY